METFVHETVHNNVHLSDLLTPLFREPERLKEADSLVPSAIRVGPLRPLNGAYHRFPGEQRGLQGMARRGGSGLCSMSSN